MRVKIPTSLDEVTIGTFIKISQLTKPADMDDIEWGVTRICKILALLTGEQEKVFWNVSAEQIKDLTKKIAFIDNVEPIKPPDIIKIGGRRFKANTLVNELSAAQFIDLNEFIKQPVANLHKVMATLYLPTKKRWFKEEVEPYDGTKHPDRATLFYREMPVSVALGVSLFFYQVCNGFNSDIQTSLLKQAETQIAELIGILREQLAVSTSDGGGTQSLTV